MSGQKSVRFASRSLQSGFTMIPNVVLRNHTLSVPARLLYALLTDYARRDEKFWPGQKKLAEHMRVQERQLRRYVDELEVARLVETTRRGLGQVNGYVVLDPEAAADRSSVSDPDRSSMTGQNGADRSDLTGHQEPVQSGHPGPIQTGHTRPPIEEPRQEATSPATAGDVAEQVVRTTSTSQGQQDERALVDLSAELRPYVQPVVDRLAEVATANAGAIAPSPAAVARVLARFPRQDFIPAADDYVHWALHGRGQGRKIRDVVRAYRNWLEKCPAVLRKTPPPGAGVAPAAGARHQLLAADTKRRIEEAMQ
ncbi:MAG: helix-turn-helix domain-containing protein [Actinomycetota bacterium]|nr:helix-turn-helix domain-containing protein [Actinomycetota bacterium]